MAINQNHSWEELEGTKCAIVEKMVRPERVAFLRKILEVNGYQVRSAPSPPPKPIPIAPPAITTQEEPGTPILIPAEPTFTIGVTDLAFNTINAIFGRLLKTSEGRVVTLSYWREEEAESQDEIPYFQRP